MIVAKFCNDFILIRRKRNGYVSKIYLAIRVSNGVNHNKFSLRDEIDYQFAQQKRENELQAQYNAQGITENYPQYITNFWGNAANNIGLV